MSKDFERLNDFYQKKWATKTQLQKYVQFGVITAEEYEMITGDPLQEVI